MVEVKHTPGPWFVGYRAYDICCKNAKIGGQAKLFDVRGWGYLTGSGHGALGLSQEEAYEIQKANAALAAAAPDLFEFAKEVKRRCIEAGLDGHEFVSMADAVLSQAQPSTQEGVKPHE